MKLWKLSQKENGGYDTYSDCIVAANTKEQARVIWPNGKIVVQCTVEQFDNWEFEDETHVCWEDKEWAKPEFVAVEYLGQAKSGTKAGVICASFHAG